jgi:SM-20-related protein
MVDGSMHSAAPLSSRYHPLFDQLIDDLVKQGWNVTPNFFTAELSAALHDELLQHAAAGELRAARIGKGAQQTLRSDIRSDATLWLDGATQPQRDYLELMEVLRQRLNRELFLGLNDLEAHFALYPPGSGYSKHLDSFRNNNLRRITVVSYMNKGWRGEDGGELLLFNDSDEVFERVAPEAGTLVCFVSAQIPHQVAITQRPRASIAGWFRVRDNTI